MIHELKCAPAHFRDVYFGVKTAECRVDDRTPRFRVGDLLWLREYSSARGGEYLGGEALCEVSHVLRSEDHESIREGYAVLSIALVARRDIDTSGSPDVLRWEWGKP